MALGKKNPGQLVFGLDIGTRSVVGTVGYKTEDTFHVVAQYMQEHATRSMLDGQIHDIDKVGHTILDVKEHLEKSIGRELNEVCIAAAGRVLKTITASAAIDFPEETTVDQEHIYTLEMLGIEKAYEDFQAQNDTGMKFYCVGYTVMRYFLNDYLMTSLDRHKANRISVELIATFLPDEVVDGLYKAVEVAGLEVANLTLEPIAAMTAAIPPMYRMLNIALVDVGAGTSDISITKDGSIIAYGMIPKAGDELTETIARSLLLDFNEAEHVKIDSGKKGTIKYTDIMGLQQKIEPQEALAIVDPLIHTMTKEISDKIKELNGEKPVSAVFVVGGGGKVTGFTDALAEEMGILAERVALRGEEVLKNIDYQFDGAQKDSLYVTPIGICLNFYDQRNNFIFVNFNGKRIKLYDNGHLTVADAAMQAAFPNDGLFPKRGQELTFNVNGKPHMIRGQLGEPASVKLNGKEVALNAPIQAGDKIRVEESTAGEPAKAEIRNLLEYGATIVAVVNDKKVLLPKFAQVNGVLQSEYYDIQSGDDIHMLNYYTVGQIAEFMDVILKKEMNIYVNNKLANLDTKVYDNFSVIWSMEELQLSDVDNVSESIPDSDAEPSEAMPSVTEESTGLTQSYADLPSDTSEEEEVKTEFDELPEEDPEYIRQQKEIEAARKAAENIPVDLTVIVNGEPVTLTGKTSYIFVDVFDCIDFDLSKPQGKAVVTILNDRPAQYAEILHMGDVLKIYWEE